MCLRIERDINVSCVAKTRWLGAASIEDAIVYSSKWNDASVRCALYICISKVSWRSIFSRRVGEGPLDPLELHFRFATASLILERIWMPFLHQIQVSFLHFILRRIAGHPEDGIRVLIHGVNRLFASRSRSSFS
jgi:hypothetical protein